MRRCEPAREARSAPPTRSRARPRGRCAVRTRAQCRVDRAADRARPQPVRKPTPAVRGKGERRCDNVCVDSRATRCTAAPASCAAMRPKARPPRATTASAASRAKAVSRAVATRAWISAQTLPLRRLRRCLRAAGRGDHRVQGGECVRTCASRSSSATATAWTSSRPAALRQLRPGLREGRSAAAASARRCEGTLQVCDGRCVDPASDAAHCGECGQPCTAPDLRRTQCEAGVCAVACDAAGTRAAPTSASTPRATRTTAAVRRRLRCTGVRSARCMAGECDFTCMPGYLRCGGECVDATAIRATAAVATDACGAAQVCASGTCSTLCPSGHHGLRRRLRRLERQRGALRWLQTSRARCRSTAVARASRANARRAATAATPVRRRSAAARQRPAALRQLRPRLPRAGQRPGDLQRGPLRRRVPRRLQPMRRRLREPDYRATRTAARAAACAVRARPAPRASACSTARRRPSIAAARASTRAATPRIAARATALAPRPRRRARLQRGQSATFSATAAAARCGGACAKLDRDPMHCGACNTPCVAPTGGSANCDKSQCVIACDAGLSACSGQCVDTRTDAANCGGCGIACPAMQSCVTGVCTPPTPPPTMPSAGG